MLIQVHAKSATFFVNPQRDMEKLLALGFKWNKKERVWTTKSFSVIAALREHLSDKAKEFFERYHLEVTPWNGALPESPSGLTLSSHQFTMITFALERNRCYIAADAGTGKTPVAATLARVFAKQRSFHDLQYVLYVTPPFLYRNIIEEFSKWAPELSLENFREYKGANVILAPDTLLHDVKLLAILKNIKENGGSITLIVDEAHRFKSSTARRTKALYGSGKNKSIVDLTDRHIFLSGTPMPNRPMELYSNLSRMVPDKIGFINRYAFGMRYCLKYDADGKVSFNGSKNEKELFDRFRHPTGNYMLRVDKSVLNLPPKTEEVFLLTGDINKEVRKLNFSLIREIGVDIESPDAGIVIINNIMLNRYEHHMATYRRLLGIEKARLSIPMLKDILENTDESVLVFAYHKEVIEILKTELKKYKPYVITGDVSNDDRHTAVKDFQRNKNRKIFIGNYVSMGVGFTLTKATRVIFVEFSWNPGENDQASDRAHRIGQTEPVLVQYLAVPKSIDAAVLAVNLHKRDSIRKL